MTVAHPAEFPALKVDMEDGGLILLTEPGALGDDPCTVRVHPAQLRWLAELSGYAQVAPACDIGIPTSAGRVAELERELANLRRQVRILYETACSVHENFLVSADWQNTSWVLDAEGLASLRNMFEMVDLGNAPIPPLGAPLEGASKGPSGNPLGKGSETQSKPTANPAETGSVSASRHETPPNATSRRGNAATVTHPLPARDQPEQTRDARVSDGDLFAPAKGDASDA